MPKATEGLPNDQNHDRDAKHVIKFVEHAESKGEYFGWNSIATNIGPNNIDTFNTQGKLAAEYFKNYCNPKWTDGSTARNLQFCVKYNVMCLFIKNSIHQSALENTQEERIHWKRPDGGRGIILLISICNKNAHRTIASEVLATTELLSMKKISTQHPRCQQNISLKRKGEIIRRISKP